MDIINTFLQDHKQFVDDAIGILRVSTSNQANKGTSFAAQEHDFLRYCQEHHFRPLESIPFTASGFEISDQLCFALDRCHQLKARAVFVFENRIANTPELVADIKRVAGEMGMPLDVIHAGLTPTIRGGEWTSQARAVKGTQSKLGIQERIRRGLPHGRPANPNRAEVLRHRANGHTYGEIAILTGLKPDTVKKIIKRGQKGNRSRPEVSPL